MGLQRLLGSLVIVTLPFSQGVVAISAGITAGDRGSSVGVHVNADEGRGVRRLLGMFACGQVSHGRIACELESACRCIIAMPPFRFSSLVAFWHCFIA